MKRNTLTLMLLAAFAAGPAFAQVTSDDATADRTSTPKAAAGAGDAEAIAAVSAVNDHEIKAAKLAMDKGVDGDIAKYAKMMDEEHSTNQRQAEQLTVTAGIKPAETDEVKAMKTKTAAEREKLAAMSGDAFEAAYVDAMVKDHAEVLAKLDDKLIPNATNPAVKEHLTMTRKHVAMHLEEARRLDAQAAD